MSNLGAMLVRPFAFLGDSWNSMIDGLKSDNKLPSIIEACVLGFIALAILYVLIRHEPRRKFFVALKRKPQQIPLVVFTLAFMVYSFNLTHISNTTNYIQATNMGLTGFATMLCSVLLLMCCMNAFPYRKKVNIPMLILTCVLIGVLLYCDYYYFFCISGKVLRTKADYALPAAQYASFGQIVNAADIATTSTVLTARNVVKIHAWILAIGALLIVTLPVYSKLIRKIKTSIDVEGNENMGAIDISGE